MNIFRCLAFSALFAMSVSGANAQVDYTQYNKGVAAYKAGEYKSALYTWIKVAKYADDPARADAQNSIGLMYDNGKGVIQNYVEAVKWYRLAADRGHANARYNLGVMYDNGKGIIENDIEAFKLYMFAAEHGDANAQNHIGMMFSVGAGFIKSNVIAHMWYNIASANGKEEAAKQRDDIALKMTRAEIATAQAMAQECFSSGYEICGE